MIRRAGSIPESRPDANKWMPLETPYERDGENRKAKEFDMRVMVIVKVTKDSEAGVMPSADLLAQMGKFNEELIKAGVMLDGAGLKATSNGARVRFTGSDRTVINGPFTQSTDLIAGYWIWKVGSLEEAIGWAKRCPHPHPGTDTELEIRPLFEESDFA